MSTDHHHHHHHSDAVPVKIEEGEIIKFTSVIAAAFADDALNRYIFLGRESRPGHPKLSQPELRLQYWLPHIRSRLEGGGILLQTHDWAAVALWLPPGVQKPQPSDTPIPEGAVEYREKFGQIKKKYLGDRLYWYLNLIGRAPGRTEKGAIRNLVEPFLRKAKDQNLPVWLEATNEHARDVYIHLGFRVVEEVRIGVGVVNAEGWAEPGGEGVLNWGMVAGL
ncbi:hypothetical protein A1O1_08420 [Capronia coronata CBS 617.96]|uniref:N-acetyltransferase domain-containing protein n=1 Tax=Capronia coronata CBS 617.96 TaxID=1182541 RepID=W9XJ94_9EURO|nr:uncharacterized protein A1O1_08420 [Capronia coronata CBS 617.96]EXJ80278.1 hypothetical protein A1O1_08420 [Capronia coronata CBS 617.96]